MIETSAAPPETIQTSKLTSSPEALTPPFLEGKGPKAIQSWYGLYVRSNCESLVEERLNLSGEIEAYWPSREEKRIVLGRERLVKRSLFPGYVFARFDLEHRLSLMKLPQVVHILGSDKPIAIPDSEVQAVRQLAAAPAPIAVEPLAELVEDGQEIEVIRGPHWLRGLQGIVVYHKNRLRVVVSVALLGQQISTEVDAGWLRRR